MFFHVMVLGGLIATAMVRYNSDTDDDNDGVADSSDNACDASEASDNDSDGVGNNADLDDDNMVYSTLMKIQLV